MRTMTAFLLLPAIVLMSCGRSSDSSSTATAPASAQVEPPPPPPPFRDCTDAERQTVATAAVSYAGNHTECVINKGPMTSSIDICKVKNDTGYISSTSHISFTDSFTHNPYTIVVSGAIDPAGGDPALAAFTSGDDNYNSACKMLGLMVLTACASSSECRNGGSNN
jgi:hypothetical protein